MLHLKLYYPNNWRKNIGDLVDDNDKKFNWFLCSKRYQDQNDSYVAEIKIGTKFYDEKTGVNYIAKKETKVLIAENAKEFSNVVRDQSKLAYDGVALSLQCENPEGSIICPEVVFAFKNNALDIDYENASEKKKSDACPIIIYSKTNYKCIKSKIKDFPSPDEIDKVLNDGYSLSIVSKVLYNYILEYLDSTK